MKSLKNISLCSLIALLSGTGVHAEEDMSTALLTTGDAPAQDKRVHQTEIPWFVWQKDAEGNYNVTGGSFAEIDAYTYYLSQTTFNNREVTTSKSGGELDKLMLTTSEFSRLGASSEYLRWLSVESFDAADIENIIAGHVNIDVQKPLETMPGLHVNAAGAFNSNSDEVYDSDGAGGQAGISYSDQFFDDSLGVMFLSGIENIPVADKVSKAWYAPDWDNGAGRPLNAPNGYTGGTIGGESQYIRNYLGLQWQPSSSFEVNYDILYTTLDKETTERGYEIDKINRDTSVNPAPPIPESEVFEGTYTNPNIEGGSIGSNYKEDDNLLNTGLGLTYNAGMWTVDANVDYSKTEYKSTWRSVKSGNIGTVVPVITLPGDGSFGVNQDLLNLNENFPANLTVTESAIDDELGAAGVDFMRELDFSVMESVVFGVRGTGRSKTTQYEIGEDAAVPAPFGDTVLGAAEKDGVRYLIFDIERVIADNFSPVTLSPDYSVADIGGYDADEMTAAAYTKVNFSRKFDGGIGLLGNVGLRAVSVQTESAGNAVFWDTGINPPDGGWNVTPVSGANDYVGILPSLNLTLFPEWGNYSLGFGATRRIAKAPLDLLNPSTRAYSAWEGGYITYIDGGNPNLDPWEINQFDLKFDWHFMDFAYFSAVGSYKHLDTYIAQGLEEEFVNAFDITSRVRPVNKHNDSIRSFSLRYSQPFAFIPDEWGGMGLFLSGTVTDSDATETARNPIPGTGQPLSYSLRGLADVSTVSALWYTLDQVSLVLRHKYRSEYTTVIEGYKLATVRPTNEFSFRITYAPTKKVSFLLEVQNLTDEVYSYYYDQDKRRPGETTSWGRSYLLGLNYTF